MGMHAPAPTTAEPAPTVADPAMGDAAPTPVTGTLVYLAPHFPGLHQTYVQREVRRLRARGWTIQPVGLNVSQDHDDRTVDDLRDGAWTLYERGAAALVPGVAAELLAHPVRGLRTLGMALRDAVAPGEPTAGRERVKAIGQAVVGLALARRLRPLAVRHVHCHFAHAATTVGMYAASQLGVPFSFTGHANDLFQRRCLLRRKLQRAAFVGCISAWHRALYESVEPVPAGKYRMVRCGVEVEAWAPAETAARGPSEPMRIATVGRLVEKKGIDTLIEALPLLEARHGRRARLVVAGDGPLRGEWAALATRLGCADRVEWLGDVDNPRIRRLLSAEADVLALPCRTDANGDRDGIPVVLMEAMACGLPVVSGDLPAVRELVADGRTGLLVPGADPTALADALGRLAADPSLRNRLGAAGRDHVRAEFALDVNIDRLERALRAAAGAPPGGAGR
jgi:glycosyltransferase involved in cell wall biosynthesis